MIKTTADISQDYYPEILGQLFIINASGFFKLIWALVKGFINDKTRRKIMILGHDYLPKLLQVIDRKVIPRVIGGDCTCPHHEGGCIESDIGPWNPISL